MRSLILVSVIILTLLPALDVGAQISHQQPAVGTGPLPVGSGATVGGVPVGTILPYIGPLNSLPPEWLPCDGRTVEDRESPLVGVQLPNLVDNRFLMGVDTADMVGVSAGSNTVPQSGHHSHNGQTSGRIREQSGTPRRLVNSGDRTFQHTHQIQIQTDGGHNHGGENRPLFYGVRFIVKVK